MKKYSTVYKTGKFTQMTRRVLTVDGCERINTVCAGNSGELLAGTDKGLFMLTDGGFVPCRGKLADKDVTYLSAADGCTFAGCENELYMTENSGKTACYSFNAPVVSCADAGEGLLWVLTGDMLYKIEKADGECVFRIGVPGKAGCLIPYKDGRVYVGTLDNGLYSLVGKRWHWCELKEDTTGLLSNCVNCLDTDPAGNIWAGTDKGVCVYDDNSLWLSCITIPSLTSLPVNDMKWGKDGDRYYATDKCLVIQHNGKLSYYGCKRWLPVPKAEKLALTGDGRIYVLTRAGITEFTAEEMTLEEKAFRLREFTERHNVRKDGYVLPRKLDREGVVSENEGFIPSTDNDGLRTGVYTAALCFEYACTKNEEVRKLARRSLLATIKLTEITGIEGFSARALRYPDEKEYGTGARHEWHITGDRDGNELEWLGETSSDEMVGHFYCYANYYDLAADEEEKALIADTVRKILDHIIKNNFRLVDTDGKPTTWANWDPELLNNDQKWMYEKGTNSLQLMTFLKVGEHITGDKKYGELFDRFASDKHYLMNLMQYRIPDGHLCHIDDNHDFLMISLLMKYTEDERLKAIFAMGLEHHWQDEKIERNAFYNFVYGALTGDRFNADDAIDELYEYPLDQISWSLYNSYRPDLEWDLSPLEMGMVPQLYSPLPAHERRITDNDCNRFVVDNGADEIKGAATGGSESPSAYNVLPSTGNDKGLEVIPSLNFLHPYWYARYHGLIE